jgi:hypothetical protein
MIKEGAANDSRWLQIRFDARYSTHPCTFMYIRSRLIHNPFLCVRCVRAARSLLLWLFVLCIRVSSTKCGTSREILELVSRFYYLAGGKRFACALLLYFSWAVSALAKLPHSHFIYTRPGSPVCLARSLAARPSCLWKMCFSISKPPTLLHWSGSQTLRFYVFLALLCLMWARSREWKR